MVCPLLIFGIGPFPEMGVTGAAVGTNIGRGTAVLDAAVDAGVRPQPRSHHARGTCELVPAVMWNVCRLSGSGFLQILIDTSSYIGLVRVISTFGSDALAGYTIGIRTVIFAILPAWGLSNAAATMVGQALGAGKPERAEEAVWTAAKYNAIVLGAGRRCVRRVRAADRRDLHERSGGRAVRRSAACGSSARASCSSPTAWC